jgi:exosome complex RNA-binding protein Rrp42 (RNase PH superfamily)
MCSALNADMHACVSVHVCCCCCSSISELQRVLSESGALPLRSLVIIPDKQVWLVNIDVLVMDNGGNLLDAIVMAVKAAMLTTTYEQHARIGLAAVISSCSPQPAAVRPQAAAESLAHCSNRTLSLHVCAALFLAFLLWRS